MISGIALDLGRQYGKAGSFSMRDTLGSAKQCEPMGRSDLRFILFILVDHNKQLSQRKGKYFYLNLLIIKTQWWQQDPLRSIAGVDMGTERSTRTAGDNVFLVSITSPVCA